MGKILLAVFLTILAVLALLLLLNVRVNFGVREGFWYALHVAGIPVDPALFAKKRPGKDKGSSKEKKKDKKKDKREADGAADGTDGKKKAGASDKVSLILDLTRTALDALPKTVRVTLRKLAVTVGCEDAAETALLYGRLYALVSGSLALLDAYRGLFYGFRCKRGAVALSTDFLRRDTATDIEVSVSFFVWQLLFAAVRLGVVYLLHLLKNTKEKETV